MSAPSPSPIGPQQDELVGPFTQLIADAQARLDLSVREAAARVTDAAWDLDKNKTTVHASAVHGWLHGKVAQPRMRRWIAVALDIPLDELHHAAAAQQALRHRAGRAQLRPAAVDHTIPIAAAPYDHDDVERRQFLEHALTLIATTGGVAVYPDLQFRLLRTLTRPNTIDGVTADYLDHRATEYWRMWSSRVLPSTSFLHFVLEDLQRVTTLLEGSLPTALRTQLMSTTGNFAMLAGVLLWDMRSYADSRSYLRIAATASRDANNPTLSAVTHGWMSFAWSYDTPTREGLTEALISVKSARSVQGVRSRVQHWLAAVEAELYAHFGDERACLQALSEAEASALVDPVNAEDDYWTHCDIALLAGYKGACYLRLRKPQEAQVALREALRLTTEQRKRVLPNLLADLGRAYAMDGRVDEACEAANQAMDLSAPVGSVADTERLTTLIQDLTPWRAVTAVQSVRDRLVTIRQSR